MGNRKAAKFYGVAILLAASVTCAGETISYTGSLASSEDTFATSVTLATTGDITLQTYGFGGGVNAAGTAIAPGGFDAFVGLFSGMGASAVFEDGTSDILTNYAAGCPPAGSVTIGTVPGQCGDVTISFSGLAAGTYTVLLTDAAYLPAAVFEGSPAYLVDGFIDLTGGVFQTCVDQNNCNTDTANWALDVTTGSRSALTPTPEPPSGELAGMGAALIAGWMYSRKRMSKMEAKEVV